LAGPLKVKVWLPQSSFSVGQNIPIKVSYVNQGEASASRMEISLIAVTTLTSHTPKVKTKQKEHIVTKIRTGGVKENSSAEHNCSLTVPTNITLSNTHYCNVVQVHYCLKFEVCTGFFNSNIKFGLPVLIGCFPVVLDQPTLPSPPVLAPTAPGDDDWPSAPAEYKFDLRKMLQKYVECHQLS
jgi:hypothetical protein